MAFYISEAIKDLHKKYIFNNPICNSFLYTLKSEEIFLSRNIILTNIKQNTKTKLYRKYINVFINFCYHLLEFEF